jgi:hypothetical protein
MNKFNNTLAGTDCGDAGLPAHSRAIARAKPVLRAVPNVADNESMSPPTTAVAERVAQREITGVRQEANIGTLVAENCFGAHGDILAITVRTAR